MKYKGHIFSAFLLFFTFVVAYEANAKLLEDCIKAYDFGGVTSEDSGRDTVVVYPVNKTCQEMCDRECGYLSRKSPEDGDWGMELNDGPILECMSNCRKGQSSSYIIKQDVTPSSSSPIPSKRVLAYKEATVSANCTVEGKSNTNESKLDVASGDKISFTMANSLQKVFLCGRKIIEIKPIFNSTSPADWSNSSAKVSQWKSKNENKYTIGQSTGDFNALTVGDLWNYDISKPKQDIKFWSARNPEYTDTGLYIQDGDEVIISWDGLYASSGIERLRGNVFDRLIKGTSTDINGDITLFDRTGRMHIKPPGSAFNSMDADVMYGERTRSGAGSNYLEAIKNIGKIPTASEEIPDIPATSIWHGLEGKLHDLDVVSQEITTGSNCDTKEKRLQNYNACHITTNPGNSQYSFSGTLEGFSTERTKLGVKHHDGNSYNYYNDNLGGNNLTISVSGCPIANGANLQYAISSKAGSLIGGWSDVPADVLSGDKELYINQVGKLVFRIKPNDNPYDKDDELELYDLYSPHNYHGSYTINLRKVSDEVLIERNGPFRKLVKTVYDVLYKNEHKKTVTTNTTSGGVTTSTSQEVIYNGIVGLMYQTLTDNSVFQQAVMALLVVYLSFSALGFIIGTIEIKQQDLIIRIVKIAFVIAVISPQSYKIFYEDYLGNLIDGGIELIAIIVVGSLKNTYNLSQEEITKDPSLIFMVFDGLWTQFGEGKIWWKILTLAISSFMGFFMALLVIISMLYYALALLKATLAYMMSLIIISILLFATPFFIPMMLFELTKNVFDAWWKMILSYLLQPVGLFAGIVIFNMIYMAALYASLSFTICPTCYVGIFIPIVDEFVCILPWMQMMVHVFEPDGMEARSFISDTSRLATVIILLITAHGMMIYSNFITSVIGSIASDQLTNRSQDLSAYSGQATAFAANKIAAAQDTARTGANKVSEGYKGKKGDNTRKHERDQRRR